MKRRMTQWALLTTACCVAGMATAQAGELVLEWSAATDAMTVGYQVEVLDVAGESLMTLDAGEKTRVRIEGLADGQVHRFRIRPYDQWGQKARTTTDELVSLPAPQIDAVQGQVIAGQSTLITLNGRNFAQGAQVVSKRMDVEIGEVMVMGHEKILISLFSQTSTPVLVDDLLVVNPVRKSVGYVQSHPVVADVSRSGQVDFADLETVKDKFGTTRSEASYLPQLDLNDDGIIDGEDVALIRALISSRGNEQDAGS